MKEISRSRRQVLSWYRCQGQIANLVIQDQLARLSKKFPSSPRLLVLQGMYLEVRGQYASARIIYHGLLGKREGVVVDEVEGDDGSDGRRVMDLWRGEPDECLVVSILSSSWAVPPRA